MRRYSIGVVADTHVLDRRRKLDPALLPMLRKAGVQQILHAGDITLPRVLRELEEVAPVVAVRGNRDWFRAADLPLSRVIEIQGKQIGMTHGHGGLGSYLRDKLRFLAKGPAVFSVFKNRAIALLPSDVDAIVFGHTHAPMLLNENNKLIVNPGSACCQIVEGVAPSFGLIHIIEDDISGEIVYLE